DECVVGGLDDRGEQRCRGWFALVYQGSPDSGVRQSARILEKSTLALIVFKRAALAAPAGDLRALLARFGQADRDRLFAALYATTLSAFAAAQRAALAAPHRAFDSFTGRSSISWHRVLRFRSALSTTWLPPLSRAQCAQQ